MGRSRQLFRLAAPRPPEVRSSGYRYCPITLQNAGPCSPPQDRGAGHGASHQPAPQITARRSRRIDLKRYPKPPQSPTSRRHSCYRCSRWPRQPRPKFRCHALAIGVLQPEPAGSLRTSSAPVDPRGWNHTNPFFRNALACSNLNLASFGTYCVERMSMHKRAQACIKMHKNREPGSPRRRVAASRPVPYRTTIVSAPRLDAGQPESLPYKA